MVSSVAVSHLRYVYIDHTVASGVVGVVIVFVIIVGGICNHS